MPRYEDASAYGVRDAVPMVSVPRCAGTRRGHGRLLVSAGFTTKPATRGASGAPCEPPLKPGLAVEDGHVVYRMYPLQRTRLTSVTAAYPEYEPSRSLQKQIADERLSAERGGAVMTGPLGTVAVKGFQNSSGNSHLWTDDARLHPARRPLVGRGLRACTTIDHHRR